jgi:hypothetical protein
MRNIIKTYLMLLLFCSAAISAHAQKWLWAYSGGSNQLNMPDRGFGLALGEKDTIFNLGAFSEQLKLDVNHNMGLSVARFIAKYAPDGTPIASSLIKRISSGGVARALGFGSFNKKNFFVSGDIDGSYYFDTVIASGGGGGYIAKFDKNTRCKWVKTAVSDDVQSMAFDDRGSMYIIGTLTSSTTQIDTFKLYNSATVIGGGYIPWAYTAKLDSDGKCVWIKQSYGKMQIRHIVQGNNNLFYCGDIDSCVAFGNAINNTTYCPNGYFLMQLDTLGNVRWFNPLKKLNGVAGYSSIGVDKNGNCYAAGNFNGNIDLVSDIIYKKGGGSLESFIIKYKPDGSVAWNRQIYGDSVVSINYVHTNDAGYTYIAGRFSGTAIFDKDTVRARAGTDTETLERNMFIARYDANGNYLGVKTVFNAFAEDITTDDSGNAIVTGRIRSGTTRFDDIERTSNGGDDYFVAKLSAITGSSSTVKAVTLNDKLMIYANPNRGNFTIDVPQSIASNTTAHLQIYNTAGSLIKDETVDISSSIISIDLGTVSKGLYTVTLSGSNFKKFTGKVMVE